jgi:hypothetical protein
MTAAAQTAAAQTAAAQTAAAQTAAAQTAAAHITAPAIGTEQIRAARETLRRYKADKANLEKRIIDNEQFWKLRHWEQMSAGAPGDPKPASAWLVNVVLNRHADAVDNYPEPNCLPRSADDVQEARKLTKILPVILGRKIKTVSASDMNTQIEDLLKERAIIIDDLGKEPAKLYGQPDTSFYKLCNAAEQRGILLIITTNLATTPVSEANRSMFPLSIQERYGNDVLSRLRATTTVVGFSGDDMRK